MAKDAQLSAVPAYITQIHAAVVPDPNKHGKTCWEASVRSKTHTETAHGATYESALARAISILATRRA